MDLTDHAIAVTGGAGALGRFLVDQLWEVGAIPVVLDRNSAALDALRSEHADIKWHQCDLTDETQVEEVSGQIERAGNAAVARFKAAGFGCEWVVALVHDKTLAGYTGILEDSQTERPLHQTLIRTVRATAWNAFPRSRLGCF